MPAAQNPADKVTTLAWKRALGQRFPDLSPPALSALAALARREQLDAHSTLLRAGERWQHVFWLERGLIRLYYVDRNGFDSNKNFFVEGAFIWPVTGAMQRQPVGYFIGALTRATVWRLPYATLESAVGDLPSWSALRFHALSELLDEKMRREQSFLQCTARQRYENLLCERPEWTARIPLRHLASYLGMTDVSLSRLRASMGLIKG